MAPVSFGSKVLEYRRLFSEKPENMTRLFVRSSELGVKAVQLIGYEPLVMALEKAEDMVGDFFVADTLPRGDFAANQNIVSSLEPEVLAVHAVFCDRFDPMSGNGSIGYGKQEPGL